MCGINGVLLPEKRKLSVIEQHFFQELWVEQDLRGGDGAGFYAIGTQLHTDRRLGLAEELVLDPAIQQGFGEDQWVMVGHARKATMAAINPQALHPMQGEHLIGVHNGTLYQWETHEPTAISDTDAFYRTLDTHWTHVDPLQALIATYDQYRYGAATVVFSEKTQPDVLWWGRADRPLTFELWDNGMLWWASEEQALDRAHATCTRWGHPVSAEVVSRYSPADNMCGMIMGTLLPSLIHQLDTITDLQQRRARWKTALTETALPTRSFYVPGYYSGGENKKTTYPLKPETPLLPEWEDSLEANYPSHPWINSLKVLAR